MADTQVWKDAELEILRRLDIAAVYREMGVVFTRETPTGKGWLACHAIDRADGTASAAVNVGEGPMRGRYRDMGGEGLSINLWEFAAKFGKHGDWRAARKHYAEKTQAALPAGGEPKRPDDGIEFVRNKASDLILQGWVETKGGFDLQTIKDNGAVYGRYPKKAKAELAQYVACFPAHNPPELTDGPPSAWVIANTTGEPVVLYRGKGKEPTKSKTLSVGGSVGGLLGAAGLRALQAERDGTGPGVEVVWKVEGLTDLLTLYFALKEAGLLGKHVVISNSQGTLETVKPEWVELLKGKAVNVVHDRDRPGETGAGRWVAMLAPHSGQVREVRLPYPVKESHGEDIRDFLWRDKKPLAELLALADATPPAKPRAQRPPAVLPPATASSAPATASGSLFDDLEDVPPTEAAGTPGAPPEEAAAADLLKLIGLEVLGEHADHSIKVYSHGRRKVTTIPTVNAFSYRDLIQLCGRAAQLYVHDGKDAVEGKRTMEEVRRAIAFFGGACNLDDHPPRGQGCWGHEDGVLIVNGREAALWRNGSLHTVTAPRLGQHLLEFEARDSWVSFDDLRAHLDQSGEAGWSQGVWQEAVALCEKWRWTVAADAQVAVGLILATFVQTLFAWRPQVGVMGASNSGKSTLFEVLQALFDKLTLAVQKPTEAAIRQAVDNRACALMLDEFESDAHRAKVLELIRTSSRGGQIARGTSDQRGRRFGMRHVVWTAAIELGLTREADANRFITLRLERPPAKGYGRMDLPCEDDLKALGVKLLALAVRHAHEAAKLAVALKSHAVEGVPSRVVESYAVPAAMIAAVHRHGEAAAGRVLAELLEGRVFDGRVVADENALLAEMLQSHVALDHGKRLSVLEIISHESAFFDGGPSLARSGITLVAGKGPRPADPTEFESLFVDPAAAQRFLLRGTRWEAGDLKEVLLRLPGAEWTRRRIDGKKESRAYGVAIPLALTRQAADAPADAAPLLPLDLPDEECGRCCVEPASPSVVYDEVATKLAIEALMKIDLT